MTSDTEHYPPSVARRVVVERAADAEPPLPRALLAVTRALEAWRPGAPLRYAGDPPRPFEVTEQALASYLSEVRRAWAAYEPEIFRLADAEGSPRLALFFNEEQTPWGRIESLWFSLPADLSAPEFSLDRLAALLASVCEGFGAYHGAVEDERLMMLYRARRAAERARAQLPPELRGFVPDAPPLAGVEGALPPLLLPQEFDRRRVPDAVWWINFWGASQVREVSPERARAAGWERAAEQAGGGMVLAATEEPTEVTDAAHLRLLRGIIERLGLYDLQRRHGREGMEGA
ncbi:MAG TPA: DUF5953 family protein [Pyrinomonadaceae bacterium]|nr:DUF5953 family protein [Pyrinomonadaceae bacterium]